MNFIKLFETYKSQREMELLANLIIEMVTSKTYFHHEFNVWSEPNWEKDFSLIEGKKFVVNFKQDSDMKSGVSYVVDKFYGDKIKFKGFDKFFNIKDIDLTWSKANKVFKRIDAISIDEISSKHLGKFDELKHFIIDMPLFVFFKEVDRIKVKGQFSLTTMNNEINHSEISLYYKEDFIKSLNMYLREGSMDEVRLSVILKNEFYDTLLHELQHAYDAFRSMGKALKKDKEYLKSKDKELDILSKKDMSEEDKKFLGDLHTKYLNLPHEINARFTQAINKIKFFEYDIVDKRKGELEEVYKLIPLREVIEKFKKKFIGWDLLSDKYKRKLIRKVSQFWHYEKEKKNK